MGKVVRVVRWSKWKRCWFIVRDRLSRMEAIVFLENWKDAFPKDKVPMKIVEVE